MICYANKIGQGSKFNFLEILREIYSLCQTNQLQTHLQLVSYKSRHRLSTISDTSFFNSLKPPVVSSCIFFQRTKFIHILDCHYDQILDVYFFFYIFVQNRSFLDILPNFNLLRTLQCVSSGPSFPKI